MVLNDSVPINVRTRYLGDNKGKVSRQCAGCHDVPYAQGKRHLTALEVRTGAERLKAGYPARKSDRGTECLRVDKVDHECILTPKASASTRSGSHFRI